LQGPDRIGLQHIDRTGLEHAPEAEGLVPVLTGRDFNLWRGAIPQQAQPFQIVARDRLLEPDNRLVFEIGGKGSALWTCLELAI
jgi:hypothetical protein